MSAVDTYILNFPAEVREKLEELRAIIRAAAPEAEETISYGMPASKGHQVLVYFAGYKGHVGFYPTGQGIEAFSQEFGPYTWSKGAVQFPLDAPLPEDLITRMVRYRVERDKEAYLSKKRR